AADIALALPEFGALAVHPPDASGLAAPRADRPVRPQPRLDERQGGGLVMEMVGGQDGLGHGGLLCPKSYPFPLGKSSIKLPRAQPTRRHHPAGSLAGR